MSLLAVVSNNKKICWQCKNWTDQHAVDIFRWTLSVLYNVSVQSSNTFVILPHCILLLRRIELISWGGFHLLKLDFVNVVHTHTTNCMGFFHRGGNTAVETQLLTQRKRSVKCKFFPLLHIMHTTERSRGISLRWCSIRASIYVRCWTYNFKIFHQSQVHKLRKYQPSHGCHVQSRSLSSPRRFPKLFWRSIVWTHMSGSGKVWTFLLMTYNYCLH